MSTKDVVIVSSCRTAVGSFGGALKDVHACQIAATTMKEAVRRAGIPVEAINDVRYGCCLEPYNALNIAQIGRASCRERV
jgi:acetyl-CoA C-acetyltransferase